MKLKANRLGEMLLEAGLIDQFQLESALSMQRNLGGRIGSAIVKLGYLPEETILEFLESQSKFSRVSLQDLEIPLALMTMLPADKMKHLLVVPIELRQSGQEKTLRVAMTDPTNQKLISDLQFATGCRVLPVLASEDEIRQALKNNLPVDPPKAQEPQLVQPTAHDPNLLDLSEVSASDPRLDRLLDVLKEKGILSAIDVERVKFG
jgi:type IV pilus assembly protein PilB